MIAFLSLVLAAVNPALSTLPKTVEEARGRMLTFGLREGMSQDQVRAILGPPSRVSTGLYNSIGWITVDDLKYDRLGLLVTFINGKLEEWKPSESLTSAGKDSR